jgi:hypothetical protein
MYDALNAKNNDFGNEVVELIKKAWVPICRKVEKMPIAEVNFYVKGDGFDTIFSKYLQGYEKGSMLVNVRAVRKDVPYAEGYDPTATSLFDANEMTFYYNDEPIMADFEGSVGVDTDLPSLLAILQECIVQNSANPVMQTGDSTEKEPE